MRISCSTQYAYVDYFWYIYESSIFAFTPTALKDSSVFSVIRLSSTRTSLPVPGGEKQPHDMMPPPPCLSVG